MNDTRSYRYATVVLLCFAALYYGVPAGAQIATGGSYSLNQGVIGTGGGSSSGTGYAVDGTSGQAAAGGGFLGGSYGLDVGFWTFQLSEITAPGTISGTVTYGNASAPPKYISNGTITGAGSPTVTTATGAPGPTAGQYTLAGFGTGGYTVSLSKTTGQNGITSNDAARVAQHVIGSLLFTNDNQRVAADVTGNGAVSSQDAAKIAQYAAGLPFSPPNLTGTWRFFLPPGPTFPVLTSPTTRTYTSVAGNLTGEDYVGLLLGEVTGNWLPTSARPGRPGPERGIEIDLPKLKISVDTEITVPIRIQAGAHKGIISYEFDLKYDPTIMRPLKDPVDLAGTVSSSLNAVTNSNRPGTLRVVVYGAVPIGTIDESRMLLNLRFTGVGAPGSVSPMSFERIMFNEGEFETIVTNGKITLY